MILKLAYLACSTTLCLSSISLAFLLLATVPLYWASLDITKPVRPDMSKVFITKAYLCVIIALDAIALGILT